MKKMLKKSDVLREGYIKGLMEARRIINEMIDEAPITIEQLVEYAKEAANSIIEKIEDNPDWQTNERSLEDALFVTTSDNLENYYGISTSENGQYADWFETMWERPEIRAVVY